MPETIKRHSALIIPISSIIVIMMAVFGYALNCISKVDSKIESVKASFTEKIDTNNTSFLDIKAQLSQIQTDLLWIKKELNTKK